MILLDTNAVIAVLNAHPPLVRRKLKEAIDSGERIAISSVVVFALRYGADWSACPDRDHARIDDLLAGPLDVLPFTEEDVAAAGVIRAALAGQGRQIGPYDILIAGQANARGLPLITANMEKFERVPGLGVQNWEVP